MAYVALARKYRPHTFDDFVGQEPIAQTLRNAIAQDKVHHAYIFTGSRGVGKTSMARVFAMALNCQKSDAPTPEPCGECDICRDIQAGNDLDVQELDGASNNGVDQVRSLRENARFAPNRARYRIYYIDEAHMLSVPAFNALLKTLEEPPAHVKFILSTTESSKIPETIHSRSQRFDFRRISALDIGKRLQHIADAEKLDVSEDGLAVVARRARGSMRDALSLMDQVMAFSNETVTGERVEQLLGGVPEESLDAMMEALRTGDIPVALASATELVDAGTDPPEVLEGLAGYARALLLALECGPNADLLERAKAQAEALYGRSKAFEADFLMYAIQALWEARQKTRLDLDGRTVLELALIRIARSREAGGVESLLARLEALEARIAGGIAPSPQAPTSSAPQRSAPARNAAATAAKAAPKPAPAAKAKPGKVPASWHELLQASQMRMLTRSHLSRCTMLGKDGNTIRIAVPDGTLLKTLKSREEFSEITDGFSQAMGAEIAVEFTLDESVAKPAGGASNADVPEDVREIAEMFGGRVVDQKEVDDG